ncbi:hypothetical protein H0H92_001459 [Tricholoma furcatifolium]|nr:hypothetical protein H0H92_001459 [Tricholoma furcatifolium]
MAFTKLRSLFRKSQAPKETPEEGAKQVMKDAVQNLLKGINFVRPDVKQGQLLDLTRALQTEFSMYASEKASDWFDKTCATSAALAVLSYPRHSHEVQAWIARYAWIGFYCDDFPMAKQHYLRALIFAEIEGEPFVGFVKVMRGLYDYWDAIPASCIVGASAEHINGSILEDLQTSRDMEISATSWPSYLRDKTGNSSSLALMVFPRDTAYGVTDYIQAIKDMGIFIDRMNDVLSFYKEEMAGETRNYVNMKAKLEGKSKYATLTEASREAVDAHSRASSLLEAKSTAAYELWNAFALGYTFMHLSAPRYRLAELDL